MLRVALVSLAVAAAFAAPARAGDAVEVTFLTYNTHGLPGWIAGDDPGARFPRLLERAGGYDVVLLQEDFAYQQVVDAQRRQPRLFRGNGAWLPWPPFVGSGLTVLSRLREAAAPLIAPYGICSGWFGGASDCLGHKGFMMTRLALPNGGEIDVWNTHLDAGRGERDHAVREAQLERLTGEIERASRGRAVVAGGDFNLDWDAPHERALFERFLGRSGLGLAAMPPRDDRKSRRDYLFVRSGAGAALDVLASGMARDFVDPDGAPLSDHPAVFAKVRVR